jgi:hypothetical protein
VIPKEGGNQFTYYFYGNYSNENMKQDNVDDDLRARGLTAGTYTMRQYDMVPAIGGPIVQDKLWFFSAAERSLVRRSRAGVHYNATPLGWAYTPDLDRPAPNQNTDWDWGARLTWQASPRNKISAFWSQQIHNYHHRNSDGSNNATTTAAPESTNYTEEWPNYVAQLVWKSPINNRLFVEAGSSMYVTAIPTSPSRDPGYTVDPFSIISATDTASGFCFRVSGGTGCGGWNRPFNRASYSRASASYITGSHAVKVGLQFRYGDVGTYGSASKEFSFRLTNGVPNRVTMNAYPNAERRKGVEWGYYVQDQWTRNRLTLNLGARIDHQREWVPASYNPAGLFVGERRFEAVEDVPNNWEFSPRFGVSYDVFGDGRTALKATVSRYVGQSLGGISDEMNPQGRIVGSTFRSWADTNQNFWPDCDLLNPARQVVPGGDTCGPTNNPSFGQVNPTNLGYNEDLLTGWGVRIHNWEYSAQLDHQLTPAFGLSVAWFRRVQGGLTSVDDLNRVPGDYDHFCVTAPLHPELPGGGGYEVCDLYDPKVIVEERTQINSSDDYSNYSTGGQGRTETWNGVDLQGQWRLPGGAVLSGGLSTGRVSLNDCVTVDLPTVQYCDITEPLQTSVKFIAHYPLPWYGVELSGSVADVPGQFKLATFTFRNADIRDSLGRDLSGGANDTVNVSLIPPRTESLPRVTQVDMKVAKTFRRNNLRITPSVDFINLLNANSVEGYNSTLRANWPRPVRIQFGRAAKLAFLMTY